MIGIEQYRKIQEYKELGLAQTKTAKALGITYSSVSKYWNMSEEDYAVSYTHLDVYKRQGRQVNNLAEWKELVQQELDQLYQTPTLAKTFEKLKKLFSKNAESAKVREIIVAHREIIPLLRDIATLKKQTWCNCFERLERPFMEYYKIIADFKEEIHNLYEKASAQSERWVEVVSEFNRRFRVPFTVKITNKSNFVLKDEAPNIEFEYTRGTCLLYTSRCV